MAQGQLNGSSPYDDLQSIKTDFDDGYKRWWSSRKHQDESHTAKIPGSSHDGISAGNSLVKQAAQAPRVASEAKRKDTDAKTIHGFKNEILSLKNFLLNQKDSEEFKTLAVVGRYGVGKTALCQEIFNDEAVKNAYVPRIWVSMYKTDEKEDDDSKIAMVKRILKSLGVEKETFERVKRYAEEEEGRRDAELARLLYVLYLNLWGKKYLIVLDDARKEDGWEERIDEQEEIPEGTKWGTNLSYGFPKGSGGRVIITSRDEELAKKIVGEDDKLHYLYPLTDSESVWKIYKDEADKWGIEVKPKKPGKYKEDLMNKSYGIPLVARMLGKNQPVEEEPEIEIQEAEGNETTTTTQNI